MCYEKPLSFQPNSNPQAFPMISLLEILVLYPTIRLMFLREIHGWLLPVTSSEVANFAFGGTSISTWNEAGSADLLFTQSNNA